MHVVINKFGTKISVRNRSFVVKNKDEAHSFSTNKVDSIFLMRGTSLTTDVINLAVLNDIDIVFFSGTGEPVARIMGNKFGSIATIRKKQVLFSQNSKAKQWIKEIIQYKLESQAALLSSLKRDRPGKKDEIQISIDFINKMAEKITETDINNEHFENTIRGVEGNASRKYFSTLSSILPEKYQFKKRSRRPAKDMFNAVLNYIYGILYARIESSLIKAGLDPYIGIFHVDDYNKPVLTYDIIEKYRVWADTIALRLCIKKILLKNMFTEKKGGVWLHDPGKKVVIETFNDYMEEKIQYNSRRRSRLNHIFADMQDFAQELLNGIN